MDELDFLKKDWKKQERNLPKYSKEKIYPMLLKKSTSLTKWIFVISIIEFLFWIGLDVLNHIMGYNDIIEEIKLTTFFKIISTINYAIIIVFIALYFRNFKKIRVTESIRKLMKQIIVVRNTVKCYIWINIGIFVVTFIVANYYTINNLTNLDEANIWLLIAIMSGIMLFMVAIIWLLYRVVYGILTRKLYKNYKALKQLELD
ncbi:MAG: hypothetical protein ACQESK_10530 [Bacteroidota bacterium]